MNVSAEDEIATLQGRIKDLEAALGQKDHRLVLAFDLPPKLSDLLGLLLNSPVVSSLTIRQRLEIASDAKVAIYRLRKTMAKFDVAIHWRRGYGYWLDEATKQRITEKVTSAQALPGETLQ